MCSPAYFQLTLQPRAETYWPAAIYLNGLVKISALPTQWVIREKLFIRQNIINACEKGKIAEDFRIPCINKMKRSFVNVKTTFEGNGTKRCLLSVSQHSIRKNISSTKLLVFISFNKIMYVVGWIYIELLLVMDLLQMVTNLKWSAPYDSSSLY